MSSWQLRKGETVGTLETNMMIEKTETMFFYEFGENKLGTY